ncbi:MAG: hypothetical protein H6668_11995 [Ardenticatenaceae bacterium]|nr:hypothetical protein [Ardenticatenaceae bacterium]
MACGRWGKRPLITVGEGEVVGETAVFHHSCRRRSSVVHRQKRPLSMVDESEAVGRNGH